MFVSGSPVEQELLAVLIQLILIVASARLFGVVFQRLGQPQVCGEIAAGLLLGPSLFGKLFPNVFREVFKPTVDPIFSMFSQVGLVFLLFLIGLEFDFRHLRNHGKKAISISLAGIVVPFALGLLTAKVLWPRVGQGTDERGFYLFMATAVSITALPVLGRILIEFNLHRTPLGVLTITSAAIGDAVGWTLLAAVTAMVKSNFRLQETALMILEILAYASLMIYVARPLLVSWIRRFPHGATGGLSMTQLATVVALVLISAAITNVIGIFSVFGGFLMGAILSDQLEFRRAIADRLRDFITVFFLPIFFTYTGLRTDVGTMHGYQSWLFLTLVLMAATAGKFCGCAVVGRMSGLMWGDACSVGILMNTRGLMELVAVNIGLELGLIPRSVFFMLVVMAVSTTFATAPVLRWLTRSTESRARFPEPEFVTQQRKMEPSLERVS